MRRMRIKGIQLSFCVGVSGVPGTRFYAESSSGRNMANGRKGKVH